MGTFLIIAWLIKLLFIGGTKMTQQDSSLQSQNPLSSAQNSVDNVHGAVSQAQSHPRQETIESAQNAIGQAERALEQAQNIDNQSAINHEAINQAMDELDQEKSELTSLQ
jgi:molecular chaperone DnaK (HSP70)